MHLIRVYNYVFIFIVVCEVIKHGLRHLVITWGVRKLSRNSSLTTCACFETRNGLIRAGINLDRCAAALGRTSCSDAHGVSDRFGMMCRVLQHCKTTESLSLQAVGGSCLVLNGGDSCRHLLLWHGKGPAGIIVLMCIGVVGPCAAEAPSPTLFCDVTF